MTRGLFLRIAAVSLPPVVFALWLSIPALQPSKQLTQGGLAGTSACLVVCAEVLEISGVRLGCNMDFLGVPYSCQETLLQPGEAIATYVRLPSIAGALGMAPTDGTLLRLEKGGVVIYSRSVAQQVWRAMYGGWVFSAVYWSMAGLIIWRWPKSRFSKSASWKDSAQ
jgi:hypothetical protein